MSVAGAAAVLTVASLAAGALLASGAADTLERVTESQQENWERRIDQSRTVVDITEVKNIGLLLLARLYIIADNKGATTLDPAAADYLHDGVYQNSIIMNWTAGGKDNTNVWPPGTRLYVRFDTQTVPSRATLATQNGVVDHWQG